MRSRVLKTTVWSAVAAAVWTHMPQVALRLRRLSLKCWFMGHDDHAAGPQTRRQREIEPLVRNSGRPPARLRLPRWRGYRSCCTCRQ